MQVIGIEEVKKTLDQIAPRHANNLMRATIQGIASEIAKDSKKNAPRDSGDMRRAIKAKRKRSPKNKPVSEVVITQGRSARYDAFYWRFVEYGTVNRAAAPFIKPAEERVGNDLDRIITEQFGKKLESALKRARKRQAKAKA